MRKVRCAGVGCGEEASIGDEEFFGYCEKCLPAELERSFIRKIIDGRIRVNDDGTFEDVDIES